MDDDAPLPPWLEGEDPAPPTLDSDRVKDLAGRALLRPQDMTRLEMQELAASVVSHLAAGSR